MKVIMYFVYLSSLCVLVELLSYIHFSKRDFKENYLFYVNKTSIGKTQEKQAYGKTTYNVLRHLTNVNNQAKVAHPYFSYVYNKNKSSDINIDGFYDSINFSSYKKNEKTFVIGIFGGSFAKDIASFLKWNGDKYKKRLQEKLNKKVIFMNFSLSAGKQPQQFIISSFYSDKIDLAINIDGYNELKRRYDNRYDQWQSSYQDLFYHREYSNYKMISEIYELVVWRRSIANLIVTKKLHKSAFIYLGFKSFSSMIEKKINSLKKKTTGKSYYEHKNLVSEKFNTWKKFTILQDSLFNKIDIPLIFFIQPNQYYKNSKRYSYEEQSKYLSEGEKEFKLITNGYDMMLDFAADKPNIVSLVDEFKETKDTVYRDNCCHLNLLGMEIISKKVMETILSVVSVK